MATVDSEETFRVQVAWPCRREIRGSNNADPFAENAATFSWSFPVGSLLYLGYKPETALDGRGPTRLCDPTWPFLQKYQRLPIIPR